MRRPVRFETISLAVLVAWLSGTAIAQQPAVPDKVKLMRNVEFGKGGNRALKMHVAHPKDLPEALLPVIVYVNGSAWTKDNKDLAIPKLIAAAQQGYFIVSVELRPSGEAAFPAQIEDVKCAVRYLRAKAKEYHIDTERMGAWGDSSGGHLASLLGTSANAKDLEGKGGWPEFPSRVRAVCAYCPAIDFLAPDWPDRHNTGPKGFTFVLLRGDPRKAKDKAALARKASPLTYITKDSPPFFIVHGDKDTSVPYSQSELLLKALKKAGVEAALHTVKDGNHASPHKFDEKAFQFFEKHLKGRDK
jgi:acetyl esterase/lipase